MLLELSLETLFWCNIPYRWGRRVAWCHCSFKECIERAEAHASQNTTRETAVQNRGWRDALRLDKGFGSSCLRRIAVEKAQTWSSHTDTSAYRSRSQQVEVHFPIWQRLLSRRRRVQWYLTGERKHGSWQHHSNPEGPVPETRSWGNRWPSKPIVTWTRKHGARKLTDLVDEVSCHNMHRLRFTNHKCT